MHCKYKFLNIKIILEYIWVNETRLVRITFNNKMFYMYIIYIRVKTNSYKFS